MSDMREEHQTSVLSFTAAVDHQLPSTSSYSQSFAHFNCIFLARSMANFSLSHSYFTHFTLYPSKLLQYIIIFQITVFDLLCILLGMDVESLGFAKNSDD